MSDQVPISSEKQTPGDTSNLQQKGAEEGKPQPPSESTNATLYVGNLALLVDEDKLKTKFSTIGQVLSQRVCRDPVTRQSLRYGYVIFQTHEDAKKALVDLNFDDLDGQPMRLMWCQRDPALRRSGEGNLFLKNLADHVDSQAIYETFSKFGAMLSCKVVYDGNGKSKGYGFIHFEKEQSAKEAVEKMPQPNRFQRGYQRPLYSRAPAESYTNVYVDNFDESVDETKLRELFSKFGKIKSVAVKKCPNGPPGKAHGFVDFESHEDAVKAVAEVDGMKWQGSKLYANRAMKKAEWESVRRSYREQT